MKVILYNPHADDFLAEPPHFRFLKRRALKKYGFFITEALRSGREVNVLIDGSVSAFVPERIFHKLPKWLRFAVVEMEYQMWHRINGFGPLVKRVEAARDKSDDLVLAFSYKAATGDFSLRRDLLSRYRAVVFHLSHYFVSTSEKSHNIQSLTNTWLAGDSDISDIAYFREYFFWYNKKFLILPFSVAARFSVRKLFSERQNRCVATGSFHDLTQEQPQGKYTDFINSTGSTTYHPIRKVLHEASASVSKDIDCRVSAYRDYGSTSKLKRLISHFSVSQKKYFSVDIVDLYNNYRLAVVGEELSGFPALGAFEAMACGCALIADPKYYKGLGVSPGQHFIEYDGSFDGLLFTIKSIDHSLSAKIALEGKNYVKEHFCSESLYSRWVAALSVV